MEGKKSGIDSKRFDRLLSEFAKVLGVSVADFVEDRYDREGEYNWRRDYRYKDNQTLPFFLIDLYERCTRLVIDTASGSKVYEWHDDETLEALRPLILKTLRKGFETLKNQIACQVSEKELSVIVRPSFLDEKEILMYFQYKGKEYSANTKDGEIGFSAYRLPPDACVEYMHAVEKYLVPRAKKEAKGA